MKITADELSEKQIPILRYIIHNQKAREIIDVLLTDETLYFNELYEKIRGNRANIAEILYKLEKNGVLEGKYEIKTVTGNKTPRAVRSYRITDQYRPILKRHAYLLPA
jgi:hypothetical protein